MANTFYETLGVTPNAKGSEIKAAYRKLVLKHHPDKSKDPSAPQIFRGITEAFETLGDPAARRRYDDRLADEVRRRREQADRQEREERARKKAIEDAVNAASTPESHTYATAAKVKPTAFEMNEMVRRLSILFSRQKFSECELLARQIIQVDPRQPLPYAVLGDISRARGSLEDAARMYSLALQMEPRNAVYLRNYEDILDRTQSVEGRGYRIQVQPQEKRVFAILTISAITLLACIYIILSPEKPVLGSISEISTWTVGVVVMLFMSGVSAGAALSISNLIDRIDANSTGRMSTTVLYGGIALLSFPLALIIYGIIGSLQRSFTVTTTRLMGAVASITFCLSVGAAVSPNAASSPGASFLQTVLWGGNLVYLGAVGGWTVADSLRR